MDNSNENRQLDELFRSKLEGHDSPAGEELWERLNKRRLSKAKPAWYNRKLMAAAIVSGIAVAGGIWLSMPAEREGLSASAPGDIADTPQRVAHESGLSAVTDSVPPEYAEVTAPALHTISDAGKKEPEAEGAGARKAIPVQPDLKTFEEERVTSRVEESGQVAVTAATVAEREKEDKQPETRVLIVYVRPPAKVDEVQEKPGVELAAVTENVESEVAEERKKLSLKRFFRQLKNAKTGEKINWEELGINPQRVFANVDHPGGARAGEE